MKRCASSRRRACRRALASRPVAASSRVPPSTTIPRASARSQAGDLKIRQDPKTGFFVQGLTKHTVGDYATVESLMEAATKARTVAATNMNATSSRAHTIFQLMLTQTKVDAAAGKATDKTSTINLIDLAGSERANSTGATGARLKEGSAINMSLTALGNVISALAHNSDSSKRPKKVPYRDSALTLLLKNSLGGNARTIMIAAISPADVNHDETLSTLRYADRAKQIKNKAVINEDPNEKLIRGLKEEIENLRKMLAGQGTVPGGEAAAAASSGAGGADIEELKKKMEEEREAELARMRKELEDKMRSELEAAKASDEAQGRDAAAARHAELSAQGVLSGEELHAARERAKTEAHLVNLHEDPQLTRQIYHFAVADGTTTVGRSDSDTKQDVVLGGLSIQKEHAVVIGDGAGGFRLELRTEGARTYVNGTPVTGPVALHDNSRIIFGNNHAFLFCNPTDTAPKAEGEDDGVPEEVTFDFVMLEVNKAQAAAMAAEEEKRRLEAEAEKAKAEARVKERQAEMEAERTRMQADAEKRMKALQEQSAAGDREARERQEAMLEEARKQQQVLEKKLQEQIAETERVAAKKQKEMRERSLLDEKLRKTIPMVNEANATADELAKNALLELRLMANQRKGLWTGEEDEDGEVAPEPLDTEVYVRVAPKEGSGLEGLWHYDDFMERLYAMREMYQAFVSAGRELPVPGYEDPLTDPFHVEPEDMSLGKATVFLDTLLHIMPISETTPILDYKGSDQGELSVRVVPHFGDKVPETDEEGDDDLMALEAAGNDGGIPDSLSKLVGHKLNITVQVKAARGLPVDRSVGAHVRFRFFLDERERRTPAIDGKAMNPRCDFSCTFSSVITDELLKYLGEEELSFDVWGRQDDGTAKIAMGPAKRIGRHSVAGDYDGAGAAAAAAGGAASPAVAELREQVESRQREAEAALAKLKEEEAKRESLEAKLRALEASSPRGSPSAAAAAMEEVKQKQEAEHRAALERVKQEAEHAKEEREAARRELEEARNRAEQAEERARKATEEQAQAAAAAASEAAGKPATDAEEELARLRRELREANEAKVAAEAARDSAQHAAKTAEEVAAAAASKSSRTCAVM